MGSVNPRLVVTKAVLWLLVGCGMAVALARYVRGLGATTALSDSNPWGLWVGFDVLSGVALAAGGFVVAAVVYIFRLERFHDLVRPAILTAALGYVAVALGLMVDLGRPWNIWRPMFFWQVNSPLFEVAWCVMLYLTVLLLELSPVVFEGLGWQRALRLARRATLGLVIAGIALSTLHQSSLGTLFLLAKDRLHPLWYSPILPVLFFVSAIGLGLLMVGLESATTSWLYRKEGEWHLLAPLARTAAAVLAVYVLLRVGDLWARGELHHLFSGTWFALLFVVELLLGAVVPILLLSLPSLRGRAGAIFAGTLLGVLGLVLHRIDVGGLAHVPLSEGAYFPAATELAVSVGLVSAMALIFLFFVEHFPVWEERPAGPDHFAAPVRDPSSRAYFGAAWFGRAHFATAAWFVGVAIGVVLLEVVTAGADEPRAQPVRMARTVLAERVPVASQPGSELRRITSRRLLPAVEPGPQTAPGAESIEAEEAVALAELTRVLFVDGNENGDGVLFDHGDHQRRLGDLASCGSCHHRGVANDLGTPCAVCHRDMYRATDTFDHARHVGALGDDRSCESCHQNAAAGKSRASARPCTDCHLDSPDAAFVARPGYGSGGGTAPGYRDALHVLCVDCHRDHELQNQLEPHLSRCAGCHPSRPAPGPLQEALSSGPGATAATEDMS